MDKKTIQTQIKTNKIRQGMLYKRSKFLKELNERWAILTTNYFVVFTNNTCKETQDIIKLAEIRSYKSYVRKDEGKMPAGFKIRTDDDQFYYSARNTNQKWSWIVSLQRQLDLKSNGASPYNNAEFVKSKGFLSQIQFQNSSKDLSTVDVNILKKQAPIKTAEEAKKQVDAQAERIFKQLQIQQIQLKKKENEFAKKQKQLLQQEQKIQAEKNKIQKEKLSKQQPAKQKEKKQEQVKPNIQSNSHMGSKVSELKNIFQKKMEETKDTSPKLKYKGSINDNKIKTINKSQSLHSYRSKTVSNLFEQFHTEQTQPQALKFTIDFLVKIASDQKYGYNSSVVAEAKVHSNRKVFAQIFVELITDYKDYENCYLLARFMEICVFEVPGLFNENQITIIKNRIVHFFMQVNDQEKLQVIMKNMLIMQRISKYTKNEEVKNKLVTLLNKCKRQQVRNWARKLNEQF